MLLAKVTETASPRLNSSALVQKTKRLVRKSVDGATREKLLLLKAYTALAVLIQLQQRRQLSQPIVLVCQPHPPRQPRQLVILQPPKLQKLPRLRQPPRLKQLPRLRQPLLQVQEQLLHLVPIVILR